MHATCSMANFFTCIVRPMFRGNLVDSDDMRLVPRSRSSDTGSAAARIAGCLRFRDGRRAKLAYLSLRAVTCRKACNHIVRARPNQRSVPTAGLLAAVARSHGPFQRGQRSGGRGVAHLVSCSSTALFSVRSRPPDSCVHARAHRRSVRCRILSRPLAETVEGKLISGP